MALERTTAGLVALHDATDAAHPFVLADWLAPAGITLDISLGRLRMKSAAANMFGRWARRAGLPPQATVLAQAIVNVVTTGGGVGLAVRVTDSTAGSDDGVYLEAPVGFNGSEALNETINGVAVGQQLQAANYARGVPLTISVFASGQQALARNHTGSRNYALALTQAVAGDVAFDFSSGSANTMELRRLVYCSGRYVTVTGMAAGRIAKVRKQDGTVIAQAAEVAGTAQVDLWTLLLDGTAFDVALYEADGVTLVEALAPAGGVWPGDMYAATVPNTAPNQPVLTVDAVRATEADLVGSAFSDPDAGDAQSSARWQVQEDGGDWSAPVFDSGWDPLHPSAITATGLSAGHAYEARVAYRDQAEAESPWSDAEPFETLAWVACGASPDTDWTACPRPEAGGVPGSPVDVGIGPSDGKNTEQDYPNTSATYDGVTLTWDHYVVSANSPDTFAGNPGTGQSQPFNITFSLPVRAVTVTLDNPTFDNTQLVAYDADGVEIARVVFGLGQAELDITKSIDVGENAIMRLEFVPDPRDWVTWHGLEFVRDQSWLACAAAPATAWGAC